MKTAKGPSGPMGLYNGFGVSVIGIFPFRGTYFGVNDTLVAMNPYQKEKMMTQDNSNPTRDMIDALETGDNVSAEKSFKDALRVSLVLFISANDFRNASIS